MSDLKTINTGTAIRDGLAEVAKRDQNVLFFAEGVADPSSMFGTLKDLGDVIGPERLIEMPVAENGLCGVAIGTAMMGKRPVISFQRVEFALLAIEQFIDNAAKMHYISNGHHTAPIVLRVVIGRGWGQGPEHSQSLEPLFAHIPGLKVAMPTYPADAKGMVVAAVEDDNPVVLIEHRWCHYVQGQVPDGYYSGSLDGPKMLRSGKDVTIVATSYPVLEAMRAAEALANIGVEAEVFDLRVLRPLNLDDIFDSIRKTGSLITVDTGFRILGMGSEIIAQVTESCFGALQRAPLRIGMPDHPTPSSRGMLPGLYPDSVRIVNESCAMLGVSEDRRAAAEKELIEARGDLPLDVPDPHFRGPF
ncbi:MAG: transketolase C-terminal domain-containing protein [Pseudomonadota bacterium]